MDELLHVHLLLDGSSPDVFVNEELPHLLLQTLKYHLLTAQSEKGLEKNLNEKPSVSGNNSEEEDYYVGVLTQADPPKFSKNAPFTGEDDTSVSPCCSTAPYRGTMVIILMHV